jgi:hypothetical protein
VVQKLFVHFWGNLTLHWDAPCLAGCEMAAARSKKEFQGFMRRKMTAKLRLLPKQAGSLLLVHQYVANLVQPLFYFVML